LRRRDGWHQAVPKSASEVSPPRVHSSIRRNQFTRPNESPFPSSFSTCGEAFATSRVAFKGFALYPESRARCTSGHPSYSSYCTVSRVTQSVHCSLPSYIPTARQWYPSIVPGACGCRCHFLFHRRQQFALPHHWISRLRMFRMIKPGVRHICRKPEMLAIIFIAALGQPTKLISGYIWSPNPFTSLTVSWRHRSPRFNMDPHAFSREQLNVSPRLSVGVQDVERPCTLVCNWRIRRLQYRRFLICELYVVFVYVQRACCVFLFIAATHRSLLEIGPFL